MCITGIDLISLGTKRVGRASVEYSHKSMSLDMTVKNQGLIYTRIGVCDGVAVLSLQIEWKTSSCLKA